MLLGAYVYRKESRAAYQFLSWAWRTAAVTGCLLLCFCTAPTNVKSGWGHCLRYSHKFLQILPSPSYYNESVKLPISLLPTFPYIINTYFFSLFQAYASRGYIAIAVDSRYHGERASSMTTYRDVFICISISAAITAISTCLILVNRICQSEDELYITPTAERKNYLPWAFS